MLCRQNSQASPKALGIPSAHEADEHSSRLITGLLPSTSRPHARLPACIPEVFAPPGAPWLPIGGPGLGSGSKAPPFPEPPRNTRRSYAVFRPLSPLRTRTGSATRRKRRVGFSLSARRLKQCPHLDTFYIIFPLLRLPSAMPWRKDNGFPAPGQTDVAARFIFRRDGNVL